MTTFDIRVLPNSLAISVAGIGIRTTSSRLGSISINAKNNELPWEKNNRYAGENVTDRESKRFSQGGVSFYLT